MDDGHHRRACKICQSSGDIFPRTPAHPRRVWDNSLMSGSYQISENQNEQPAFSWWQRFIQRMSSMQWASRFMTLRLHRWDRWFHRLSNGRWSATEILAGLPIMFVTTKGAKTEKLRTTPLLAISDGDQYILIATKFGADHNPAWYYNLKTHPIVEVNFRGTISTYIAEELEGQARLNGWERAVAYYPGYRAYEERAGDRKIPVMALRPIKSQPIA